MIVRGLPEDRPATVVIAGAGPAGLVGALELRRRGIEVTVLAGGMDGFDAGFQDLAEAEIVAESRHAPMHMAVRRGLGGTSLLWGGRCVPFDDIDFVKRPGVPFSGWPLSSAEVRPWYRIAAEYLDAGEPVFAAPLTALAGLGDCTADRLEKWSDGRNLRRLHAARLRDDPGLRIHLGVVATGIEVDPETGTALGLAAIGPDGRRTVVRGRAIVVACGGIETTRLLLVARTAAPGLFGGIGGPLGRFYMGHHEGRIADIVLAPTMPADAFDFFVGQDGRYARRRIAVKDAVQLQHGLLNLVAWPENPLLSRAEHRSAIFSLAYLSLAVPGLGGLLAAEGIRRKYLEHGVAELGPHLRNILRGLPTAAAQALAYLHGRYLRKPRLPGFFIRNRTGRYSFFYHAEQAPNPSSTIALCEERDAVGMRRARIDLRYGEIDARSVVLSHTIIDRALRGAGVGRLEFAAPDAGLLDSVLAQARDGYHQIGTTRMAERAVDGVVDGDCRVHGTPNLFIASSSVFPTSGQANPTLLVAALSARLADHVARHVRDLPDAPEGAAGSRRQQGRARRPAAAPNPEAA